MFAHGLSGKILILGGTYFIGKHLVAELEKQGTVDVTLFNRGTRPSTSRFPTIKGDRNQLEELACAFSNQRYDLVIDLCCYQGEQMAKLLKFSSHFDQVLFISSALVYGKGEEEVCEDMQPRLLAEFEEYARGKIAAEDELKRSGVSYLILRPSLVYGPDEFQGFSTQFFSLLQAGFPLILPQELASLGTIQPLYVQDLVRVICQTLGQSYTGQIYNVGGPILEMADYLQTVIRTYGGEMGERNLFVLDEQRPFREMILSQVFPLPWGIKVAIQSTNLNTDLGIYTDSLEHLKVGLSETYRWVKENNISLSSKLTKLLEVIVYGNK